MTDILETIRLARAFGVEVQASLTRREFREVCERNKAEGPESPSCHTHDFGDANVLMHAAFVATIGRDPMGAGGMSEADTKLWNDAWAVAKAAEFFA